MEKVDVIIADDMVLTMDARFSVFDSGAAVVPEGAIVTVGPMDELIVSCEASAPVECSGMAVMPGLIHTHTHGPINSSSASLLQTYQANIDVVISKNDLLEILRGKFRAFLPLNCASSHHIGMNSGGNM